MINTIYLTLGLLILGGVFYYIRKIAKRFDEGEFTIPENAVTTPAGDDSVDGFMCIMLSNGSTRSGFPRKESDTWSGIVCWIEA
jgi:hypothetical protein